MDPNTKGFAHLKFLKEAAEKPFRDLEDEIEARHVSESHKTENENDFHFLISDIKEETFVVDQKLSSEITIHRVFASSPDGGAYCSIGWVLAKDVNNCMSCLTALQPNVIKHHCFACGNVVCSSCYSSEAFVVEIMQLGKVNVCSDCYQYGGNVKKTNNRRASRQSLSQNRGVSLLLTTTTSNSNDNGNSTPTTPYGAAQQIDDESQLFASLGNKDDHKEPTKQDKAEAEGLEEDKKNVEKDAEEDDTVPTISGLSCFFCFAF